MKKVSTTLKISASTMAKEEAMRSVQSPKALGIFLIALGVLFLLLNNGLLWFGWEVVWPIFPLLIGLFLLKVFVGRRKPRQLFTGIFFLLLSLFFFGFTLGIFPWEKMSALWPTFPLVLGVSLLALAAVDRHTSSALVVGLALILFSVLAYMSAGGAIRPRISEPMSRLWPLVLVGAGALVFLRARNEAAEARATLTEVAEPGPPDPAPAPGSTKDSP
ncbi:MAG: hypothetical protein O7D32_06600 [bacterium]|nr:hypothetical protein [bacterium]